VCRTAEANTFAVRFYSEKIAKFLRKLVLAKEKIPTFVLLKK
jgi:hypothetical protein